MMPNLAAGDREGIADWIETTVLVRGQHLGFDKLQVCAEEELNVTAAQFDLARTVLAARSRLLGTRYPFELLLDVAIRPTASARMSPYSLLLLASPGSPARQLLHPQPTQEMCIAFERLVCLALANLLGASACAVRFGWPSDEGRPPDFHGAIEWLASKMGITTGSAYRPPRLKDGGVDVVAWRPFPDGRSGFPVVLVQCTVQGSVLPKSADIDVRYWSGWLTLDTDPLTALAIPGTIASSEAWNEIAVRCLILDRHRLSGLLPESGLLAVSGATSLVDQQVGALAPLLRGADD
jgi:hypothetical protein